MKIKVIKNRLYLVTWLFLPIVAMLLMTNYLVSSIRRPELVKKPNLEKTARFLITNAEQIQIKQVLGYEK